MECLNNENDVILTFRENKKTSLLLDVDNVTWLVETKLDDFVKNNDNHQLLSSEEKHSWNDIAGRIKVEVGGLFEVEEARNALAKEGSELEKCLEQLRAKFLSEQNVSLSSTRHMNEIVCNMYSSAHTVHHHTRQNLGQMEIDDLEAKWEQQYECNASDEEAGENSMVYDSEQPMNTSSEVAGETQVHMELFHSD